MSIVLTDSRQFQHLHIAPLSSLYTISPSYGGALSSEPRVMKSSSPIALVSLTSPTKVSISSPPHGIPYFRDIELYISTRGLIVPM